MNEGECSFVREFQESYSHDIIIVMQNFVQWDTVQKEERQASGILKYHIYNWVSRTPTKIIVFEPLPLPVEQRTARIVTLILFIVTQKLH